MLKGNGYTITKDNLLAHELIGLRAKVVSSPDKNRKGIEGVIVDETRNTLELETVKGARTVPKSEATFRIRFGRAEAEIEGRLLVARPEDRVKVFWRKYHGRVQ